MKRSYRWKWPIQSRGHSGITTRVSAKRTPQATRPHRVGVVSTTGRLNCGFAKVAGRRKGEKGPARKRSAPFDPPIPAPKGEGTNNTTTGEAPPDQTHSTNS